MDAKTDIAEEYPGWYRVTMLFSMSEIMEANKPAKVHRWMEEHSMGDWFYQTTSQNMRLVGMTFYFDLESDASLFAMRWLNTK